MVLGIAYIEWNNIEGGRLILKVPENLDISDITINQLYLAHSLGNDNVSFTGVIEISFNQKCLISNACHYGKNSGGADILCIAIDDEEGYVINAIRPRFLQFAKKFFTIERPDRKHFLETHNLLEIKDNYVQKILLLGRASTGKTSIKSIVFEGMVPESIISTTIEPTLTLLASQHSWLDVKISLLDTSGQELEHFFNDDEEQNRAFDGTSFVVYIVDIHQWNFIHDEIMAEIVRLKYLLLQKMHSSQLVVFFHKIDLVDPDSLTNRGKAIIDEVKTKLGSECFFTSIHPQYQHLLFTAFHHLLSFSSIQATKLKRIVERNLQGFSSTICFLADENRHVIVHYTSPEYDKMMLETTYKISSFIEDSFKFIQNHDQIDHLMFSTGDMVNFVMHKVEVPALQVKRMICMSENASLLRIHDAMKQILNDIA